MIHYGTIWEENSIPKQRFHILNSYGLDDSGRCLSGERNDGSGRGGALHALLFVGWYQIYETLYPTGSVAKHLCIASPQRGAEVLVGY